MNKPKALRKGDTIGLIAPSSPVTKESLKKAEFELIQLGFKVEIGKSAYMTHGYLSGTDKNRADDINTMFKNSKINGIICLRGGYGTPRILDLINYDIVKNNPKVFVGYSDITALHIAFAQRSNLITFHGPMAAADIAEGISEFSKDSLFKAIMSKEPIGEVINPEREEIVTINKGVAEGSIIGGNLSLIVDTLATPYEIDTKERILLIEEINEDPYNVDRMLNQLKLSGKLFEAEGIILGDFSNCETGKHPENLSLEQIFEDHVKPAHKPTIYNLKTGHCEPMITLPFGIRACLDADKKKLIILGSALK